MQVMRWDDIRVFLAIARTGQIARAASQLGVDATTVSRRLRAFETAIGATLFEQHSGGQRLTEAGEHLVPAAEAVERATAAIGTADGPLGSPGGLVRVSTPEGFGTWLIAHHLGRFNRACPGITVDLVASSGLLNPSKREADVAVLLARPRRGPLITRKLSDYVLRLYASQDYLDGNSAIRAVPDLSAHVLIGYIPDLLYSPELDYLGEIMSGLQPRLRSSSINGQYRMTASGAGIAVLPSFIGDTDPRLRRIIPEICIHRTFWLVTHKDTRNLPRIRSFTDWLVNDVAGWRGRLLGNQEPDL